jgi:hypothetical protein
MDEDAAAVGDGTAEGLGEVVEECSVEGGMDGLGHGGHLRLHGWIHVDRR